MTFAFVSQAPLEKLQAYKRRMGSSISWVSIAHTDFNFDLGFSSSEGQTRERVEPIAEQLPPIAAHNASSTGTDLVGYLSELFGFSSFVRDDGTVYQTYSTRGRGVEFLMGITRSSTTHRKAATRARPGSSGSAGTTSTRRGDETTG